MGLNESNGNMYSFISHTWNTIKGKCYHDCSYCYMKRWGNLKEARFDKKELNTDLGKGNFIFVGSSNDLFAVENDYDWIRKTLYHCSVEHPNNKYLFQSKNIEELIKFIPYLPLKSVICTTLESNRWYPDHMGNSPSPYIRALSMKQIEKDKYVTIEPIMDFGLGAFVDMIRAIKPVQVNIGADSGNNNLPEPEWEKVDRLIKVLQRFTIVKEKPNLDRLRKAGVKDA